MNLSSEYLDLLFQHKKHKTPVEEIVQSHREFWRRYNDQIRHDLTYSYRSAYHLAASPPDPSKTTWFLEPAVKLQRIALYSEVIIFDDFVGNVIDKIPSLPKDAFTQIEGEIWHAINLLLPLRKWIDNQIVKILPSNSVLSVICQPGTFSALEKLSLEEVSGNLSDRLAKYLSRSDFESLSFAAGHIVNYKLDKADILAQEFDFTTSPDDKLYWCLGEKLEWNTADLRDPTCHYLLKQIPTRYLCDSDELAFQIRLDGNLSEIRNFLGKKMMQFFQDDPKVVFQSQRVKEFSKDLAEEIKNTHDELKKLKRKYGSEAIIDLTLGSLSFALGVGVNYAASYASWLPSLASLSGLIPAGAVGASTIKAIKDYVIKKKEIRAKPAFILGSIKEKRK